MAVRTNAAAVGKLIKVRSTDDLTPFIESANALVNDECLDSGYDGTRLELIERWLSAHFYAVFRRPVTAEAVTGTDGVSQQFDRPRLELGLKNTTYGQQAMRLDSEGNLAAMDNEMDQIKKPLPAQGKRITWLGTAPWRRNRWW